MSTIESTDRAPEDRTRVRRALPDEATLIGFRERAREADANNEYFHDDLAVLRSIGYLGAAVPEAYGGWGLTLSELAREQRRLAHFAPATALAMCMHHYWVGIAVEMERFGDGSCRWIFERAAAGDVFAAGHAEVGNDAPVVMSTARATREQGGYRFDGRKMFGSNGPVWTFLGAHALDVSDPNQPTIVHGFVERTSDGVTVVPHWDTLGMRSSQSYDTVLEGVFVPDERIGAVVPAGSSAHPFVVGMDVWRVGEVDGHGRQALRESVPVAVDFGVGDGGGAVLDGSAEVAVREGSETDRTADLVPDREAESLGLPDRSVEEGLHRGQVTRLPSAEGGDAEHVGRQGVVGP